MYAMIHAKIVTGEYEKGHIDKISFMRFLLNFKQNYEFRELRIYCFRFIFVSHYFPCYITEDNSCNIPETTTVNGHKTEVDNGYQGLSISIVTVPNRHNLFHYIEFLNCKENFIDFLRLFIHIISLGMARINFTGNRMRIIYAHIIIRCNPLPGRLLTDFRRVHQVFVFLMKE